MTDWQAKYDEAIRAPLRAENKILRAEIVRLKDALVKTHNMIVDGAPYGQIVSVIVDGFQKTGRLPPHDSQEGSNG